MHKYFYYRNEEIHDTQARKQTVAEYNGMKAISVLIY